MTKRQMKRKCKKRERQNLDRVLNALEGTRHTPLQLHRDRITQAVGHLRRDVLVNQVVPQLADDRLQVLRRQSLGADQALEDGEHAASASSLRLLDNVWFSKQFLNI